jgi:hypothetical protein
MIVRDSNNNCLKFILNILFILNYSLIVYNLNIDKECVILPDKDICSRTVVILPDKDIFKFRIL